MGDWISILAILCAGALGVWSFFLNSKILSLEKRKTELEGEKTARAQEYDLQIRSLLQLKEELTQDRALIREQESQKQQESFERRRQNWADHENRVTEVLKQLSRKLDLNCYDKNNFPLLKRPDFAIELAGQYLVFDAKAPSDPENLSYFPEYLKKQAESLEKYLKQDGVRKEGFLVVPSDALVYLQGRYHFEMSGFHIYVIGTESLETVLRLLRKLQDFEIIEGLGPEEQEAIAVFIGQANRLMKRRVQIDQFLAKRMIEVLQSGEALPGDIKDRVLAKEKSFAINPPRVDRGKGVTISEIEKEHSKIQNQLR